MTPSSLLSAGSMTDTVFENCSAAYTRSWWLIGTSGAEAADGACPAEAAALARHKAAPPSSAGTIDIAIIPLSLDISGPGRQAATPSRPRGPSAGRGRRRWGRRLAERQPHRGDFLLLIDDDFLSEAPQKLVVTMPKFGLGHGDRALMMGNHHRREVLVDIAQRLDMHARHHPVHRDLVLGQERRFGRGAVGRADVLGGHRAQSSDKTERNENSPSGWKPERKPGHFFSMFLLPGHGDPAARRARPSSAAAIASTVGATDPLRPCRLAIQRGSLVTSQTLPASSS